MSQMELSKPISVRSRWVLGSVAGVLAASIIASLTVVIIQSIFEDQPQGGGHLIAVTMAIILAAPPGWFGWYLLRGTKKPIGVVRVKGSYQTLVSDIVLAFVYSGLASAVGHVYISGVLHEISGRWLGFSWWLIILPLYVPIFFFVSRVVREKFGNEGIGIAFSLWVVLAFFSLSVQVYVIGG